MVPNPIKMDDLGVPLFFGNTYILACFQATGENALIIDNLFLATDNPPTDFGSLERTHLSRMKCIFNP